GGHPLRLLRAALRGLHHRPRRQHRRHRRLHQPGRALAGRPLAGAPDADDLDALQLLAAQLATTLRSAQLHEQQEQLVRRLSEREQRLAELVDQLMRAQEDERRRVAYELHDGLSQMVLGVLQQIHVLADSYRPRSPRARQALGRAVEMGRAAVAEARRVIAGLRPSVLDDFGLAQALRLQVETLRREGWEVQYEEALGEAALTPAQETALFRIVQEALNNVRKHAGPTRVHIALRRRENSIALIVQDWGRGFADGGPPQADELEGGVGLESIGERVKLFGGQWQIQSRPGAGTLVEVTLPLGPSTGAQHNG
ncbi:MAG: sensor histidine kinase, partial [Chloroflexales bacterium]|nr:sensor histidine kinase [Chloroflexales bacterium]